MTELHITAAPSGGEDGKYWLVDDNLTVAWGVGPSLRSALMSYLDDVAFCMAELSEDQTQHSDFLRQEFVNLRFITQVFEEEDDE